MLHSDFSKLYTHLKQKGVIVSVLTNGTLINDSIVKLFKEYMPYKVCVSLYGMCEEKFQAATGQKQVNPGDVLRNVLKLKEQGINVTCQTPVNTFTRDEVMKLADWCKVHEVKYSISNEMSDKYNGVSNSSFAISDEEFRSFLDAIGQDNTEEQPLKNIEWSFGYKKHFECRSGRHTFALSYDGYLRPCFLIYGNCGETFNSRESMKSALEAMTGYIEQMKTKTIDYCMGCNAKGICTECLLTKQLSDNLQDEMKKRCKRNYNRMIELQSKE